ncbi:MAG TPA: AMP-binding protein, partial [Pyrinomonadaceae bacterium]|nr:AMP-binding protein [Pyrinomonadaceae bacterium]
MDEPKNIRELLERRARATPGKHFLFSEADGRAYTYAEFDAAASRAALMLAARGIKKGDAVSLLMPNGAEYVIAYFACFKLGALAGPVNSLLKSEEISYVVNNSEARALLVHPEFLPRIESIRNDLPGLKHVIAFDDEARATRLFADKTLPEVPIATDDEAIIIYTSGTTGKPKGCLLTHGNLVANARQITDWLNFTERDRLLTVMPLFHMNAV